MASYEDTSLVQLMLLVLTIMTLLLDSVKRMLMGHPILHAVPKHIWTYATGVALSVTIEYQTTLCPCNSGSIAQVPSYVGSDYYCETGNNAADPAHNSFYSNDPLWDGQQCDGVEAPCCTHPNIPWFTKTLGETTTEDIQLRLCADEPLGNEETLIQSITLYVY